MNRVLVTGGCGYIGSMVVRDLVSSGHKVTVLDSFLYTKDSLKNFEDKVNIINGDTRDEQKVSIALKNIDVVVHLAEIVGEPACDINPGRAKSVNVDGTKTIAKLVKENGIKHFIYASSCSVYGLTDGEKLFNENDEPNPVSLYAELKLEAEDYLRSIADKNFKPLILRFATVFGYSRRPRFDLLANTITATAVIDKKITIRGKRNWRPFINVEDLARAISTFVDKPVEGIFNVGYTTQNYTIGEIGEKVYKHFPEVNYVVIPQTDEDRRSYRVDFSKFESTIGLKPKITVDKSIDDMAKFLRNQGTYLEERFSNLTIARRIQMKEDLSKIVTMRTSETERRYQESKKSVRSNGCVLCAIPVDSTFPILKYWRVTENEFPYDKVAEKCWLIMPKRCVSKWVDLTLEEQDEYHQFRLVAYDYGVNFFMWSTPATQSVPGHYHEHMMKLLRHP